MGEQLGTDCKVRQFWGGVSPPLFTNLGHVNSEPVSSCKKRGSQCHNVKHLALNSTQASVSGLSLKLGNQISGKLSLSASVGSQRKLLCMVERDILPEGL